MKLFQVEGQSNAVEPEFESVIQGYVGHASPLRYSDSPSGGEMMMLYGLYKGASQ